MKLRGLRRRKKAKNVLQGFEQGAQSLFSGLGQGLYGLAYQPYLSLKQRGGVSGLLLGAAKGVTGLISKPISGVLDTVSKTAEVGGGDAGDREHGAGHGEARAGPARHGQM